MPHATRLAAIRRLAASDDARRRRITVARAVTLHTLRIFTEAHFAAGLTRGEAGRRAQKTASKVEDLFRTRKATLSHLRSRSPGERR